MDLFRKIISFTIYLVIDFTVLPDNHVLYVEREREYSPMETESQGIIKELDPESGQSTELYQENTDFEQQISEKGAHTNLLCRVPELNAISFSMRHTSTIGVLDYDTHQLMTVFGGPISDYDISWDTQHGHQLTDKTLLVFNNNGSNGGSSILEFEYDMNAHTATKIFDYSPGVSSMAFGDVKRLPGGNLFITFSTSGVFHELDPSGNLLRVIETDALGYSTQRKDLYGPPPPEGD